MALRAGRPAAPPRLVLRGYAAGGGTRRPRVHDGELILRFWSDLNPTLRGFLIIALVALVVVVLSLEQTLVSLHLIARIAFFLAIAFVLFLFWRDRRSDIAAWSRRGRAVFYGGAALILVDLGAFFWPGRSTAGLDAVVFVGVLAICGFSMFRVWRDEHTFGY